MPLYDYACQSCGKTTEILQRFDDPPLAICPHCGGELKKLLSAPAFQFKGSGWYVTDYARKGGGGKTGGASGDAASGASDSKSESKPDAKSGAGAASSTPAKPAGD